MCRRRDKRENVLKKKKNTRGTESLNQLCHFLLEEKAGGGQQYQKKKKWWLEGEQGEGSLVAHRDLLQVMDAVLVNQTDGE